MESKVSKVDDVQSKIDSIVDSLQNLDHHYMLSVFDVNESKNVTSVKCSYNDLFQALLSMAHKDPVMGETIIRAGASIISDTCELKLNFDESEEVPVVNLGSDKKS